MRWPACADAVFSQRLMLDSRHAIGSNLGEDERERAAVHCLLLPRLRHPQLRRSTPNQPPARYVHRIQHARQLSVVQLGGCVRQPLRIDGVCGVQVERTHVARRSGAPVLSSVPVLRHVGLATRKPAEGCETVHTETAC